MYRWTVWLHNTSNASFTLMHLWRQSKNKLNNNKSVTGLLLKDLSASILHCQVVMIFSKHTVQLHRKTPLTEVDEVGNTFMSPRLRLREKRRLLWTEGASCLQPEPMKVRKGRAAGGFMTELLSMFTCQVSMVSQIAIPVFSARLPHCKQTSKQTARCWKRHLSTHTHTHTHTHTYTQVIKVHTDRHA